MPRSRSSKRGVCKPGLARFPAALAAAAATLGAVALSAVLPAATASTATPHTPAVQADTATVTVAPNVIRIPGLRQAPPTTAQCKSLDGIACYQPSQLRAAYHLPALYAKGITGKGQTIVIVDSFGSPTIKSDLAAFDKAFGIAAPPAFTIIHPEGKIPAFNGSADMAGWASETTLDVEYAHAFAPGAKILLVETPVSETEGVAGFPQIVKAEEYVLAHYKVGVISQSFSATEETFKNYAQLAPLRAAYTDASKHHVTVLAASGDAGATDFNSVSSTTYYTRRVTSWPDSDPLVTAVGGTQLKQSGSSYTSVAWNDTANAGWEAYSTGSAASRVPTASGGGTSEFFARPSWQNSVKAITGARRGVPDISMSAACNGSVTIYSSFQGAGWSLICGTSEATPEFAAIVALADQVAGHPLGLINPKLYTLLARHAPGLVDVTSGNNTVSFYQPGLKTVTGYSARKGYDLVTGVGTINASLFVPELAG